MAEYKNTFKRVEKKYILTREQFDKLKSELHDRLGEDKYSYSTISNIYFDTPDSQLIRKSIEKPIYKEKLRLRCYQTPTDYTPSFVELKKKYKGVVYKRRAAMPYVDAYDFMVHNIKPHGIDGQVYDEIRYAKDYYKTIQPAMFLSYDREALFLIDDPKIRLTFDTNIIYRTTELDLRYGVYGDILMNDEKYICELKLTNAIPLDICRLFDKLHIYPASYSKYGNAYIKTHEKSLVLHAN